MGQVTRSAQQAQSQAGHQDGVSALTKLIHILAQRHPHRDCRYDRTKFPRNRGALEREWPNQLGEI